MIIKVRCFSVREKCSDKEREKVEMNFCRVRLALAVSVWTHGFLTYLQINIKVDTDMSLCIYVSIP